MRSLDFWRFAPHRLPDRTSNLAVLVADADPYARADLEPFLARRGCHAFFVSEGIVALRCLTMARETPGVLGRIDVVIADIDLPGRSGLDILAAVKSSAWDLEVVLTTECISAGLRAEVARMGAAAVFGKPVCLPELEKALARIARHRQRR